MLVKKNYKPEEINEIIFEDYSKKGYLDMGIFDIYKKAGDDPRDVINDFPMLVKRFALMYDLNLALISDTRKAYKYSSDYSLFELMDRMNFFLDAGFSFDDEELGEIADSWVKVVNDGKDAYNTDLVYGDSNEEILSKSIKGLNNDVYLLWEKNHEKNIEYEVDDYIACCNGKRYTVMDVVSARRR